VRPIEFKVWNRDANFWANIDLFKTLKFKVGCMVLEDPRFIFIQYTGIDYPDGGKVFEGDIVTISGYHFCDQQDEKTFHQIIWNEGSFWLKGINLYWEPGSLTMNGLNKNWVKGTIAECYPMEKVGTIYENPELLKPPK